LVFLVQLRGAQRIPLFTNGDHWLRGEYYKRRGRVKKEVKGEYG
jgi:hypothetical protein